MKIIGMEFRRNISFLMVNTEHTYNHQKRHKNNDETTAHDAFNDKIFFDITISLRFITLFVFHRNNDAYLLTIHIKWNWLNYCFQFSLLLLAGIFSRISLDLFLSTVQCFLFAYIVRPLSASITLTLFFRHRCLCVEFSYFVICCHAEFVWLKQLDWTDLHTFRIEICLVLMLSIRYIIG